MELYIITKPFVGGTNFKLYMHNWVRRKMAAAGREGRAVQPFDTAALPRLYVIHTHISDDEFPRWCVRHAAHKCVV